MATRRQKTVGYRVIWADGTRRRLSTRHEAEAVLRHSGRAGHVARIKINHNGTMWHERV